MPDHLVSRKAIASLRRAASSLDWNQWKPALRNALAELTPEVLLPLAESVLRDGLPTFERNNPGDIWPRRALDGLETGLGPDDSPGPGGNAYGSAVEDLVEARERTDDPERCRKLITNALSRSVMAQMAAAWGEDHPEHWKRIHQRLLEGKPPNYDDARWGWHEEPRIRKTKLDGWNDVIDRLAALTRPSPDPDDDPNDPPAKPDDHAD